MVQIVLKTVDKLWTILHTLFGWAVGAVIFALNLLLDYINGHESSIYIVTFVVVMDCIWGISRALKDDLYTTSALMRDSLAKLAVYGTLILAFIGFDRIGGMGAGFSVTIICSLIILVEMWSIAGNMLIVYPNFPVLCLLRKYLVGEIANKLNVEPDQVEEALSKRKENR